MTCLVRILILPKHSLDEAAGTCPPCVYPFCFEHGFLGHLNPFSRPLDNRHVNVQENIAPETLRRLKETFHGKNDRS